MVAAIASPTCVGCDTSQPSYYPCQTCGKPIPMCVPCSQSAGAEEYLDQCAHCDGPAFVTRLEVQEYPELVCINVYNGPYPVHTFWMHYEELKDAAQLLSDIVSAYKLRIYT